MKIAGKKNDGAWYRINKKIKDLRENGAPEEVDNLAGSIAASLFIEAAFQALKDLQLRTGLQLAGVPADKDDWATSLVEHGIPRQIWFGRLSWTTTFKDGDGPGATYTAEHQSEMHYFARDLRERVYQYFLARRALRDLFNVGTRAEGNPGGWPDANRGGLTHAD